MTTDREPFFCYQCLEAARETASYISGLDVNSLSVLQALAARYGDDLVGHRCDPDAETEIEEDVDCCCECSYGHIDVGPIEAVEAVSKTVICDECYEYTMEHMDAVGMSSEASSQLVVKVMAQRQGGDIPDHSCEAEDDEDVECRCGCRR